MDGRGLTGCHADCESRYVTLACQKPHHVAGHKYNELDGQTILVASSNLHPNSETYYALTETQQLQGRLLSTANDVNIGCCYIFICTCALAVSMALTNLYFDVVRATRIALISKHEIKKDHMLEH